MAITSLLSENFPDDVTIATPWYLESPTATSDKPVFFFPFPFTMHKVWGWTDTGTADFNIEFRGTDPDSGSGTNTMAAALQATASGANQEAFSVTEIDGENWLAVVNSAAASSPTIQWVVLAYIRARG